MTPATRTTDARTAGSVPAGRRAPGGRVELPRHRSPAAAPITADAAAPNGLVGLQIADWADRRWVDRIQDSCLLLFDRASSEHSGPAITSTVQGLRDTVKHLASSFGIDAAPAIDCIGGFAELTRRLEHESLLRVNDNLKASGRSIKTWTLVVEDLLSLHLLIALQTGSGTKIDAAYHQPAAYWLASTVIAEHRPGVLFSREWPRSGRDGFAMGPVVYELREMADSTGRPPAIGAITGLPMQEYSDLTDDALYQQGQAARKEAGWLRHRSGLARHKTGDRMLHGRVPYAGNQAAPPGLATATVLPAAFTDGGPEDWPDVSLKPGEARYLYLDTPACRPDPVLIRETHGRVTLPDGSPAPDQVDLVTWFLAHLGTRDENGQVWDRPRCARRLAESGYSTEALRNVHKRTDAVWTLNSTSKDTLRTSIWNLCRSILAHRVEYDTGTFTVTIPGGTEQTVTITDVFPAQGFWLAPGRLAEIEAYLKEVGREPGGPAHVFAGYSVQLNGAAATLEATVRNGPARYHFVQENGHRAKDRHAPIPPVTNDFLVGLLARAFRANAPLPRLAPADSPVPQLRAATREAQRKVDDLAAVQAGRLDRLDREKMSPRTYADLDRRYDDGANELDQLIVKAQAAQFALDAALAQPPTGVAHERLIDLVAALADPRSKSARELLRGALTLTATHDVIAEPGHVDRHRVQVTLTLAIHDGRGTWELSQTGSYEGGPAAKVLPRLAEAVQDLRDGVSLRDSLGADWQRWLPQIRTALGPAGHATHAHLVDDERLRQLVMAVRHPPCADVGSDPNHPRLAAPPLTDRELSALADQSGEPVALLHRIAAVHASLTIATKWLQQPSAVAGLAFRLAASSGRVHPDAIGRRGAGWQLRHGQFGPEWDYADGTLVLAACPGCCRTDRVPLRLREADGSICRRCRTDRSEVEWPPEYDRYAHPTRAFPASG